METILLGPKCSLFIIDYNHNLLTDGTPDIKSVDISPCTAQPCKFHHGMNVTVSVTFIAG